MKNARVWFTLSGALASGLLAGYLALAYVSEQPTPLMAAESDGTQVVVADRDMPAGTIVSREDLKIIDWPSGDTPGTGASSSSNSLYTAKESSNRMRRVVMAERFNRPCPIKCRQASKLRCSVQRT